MPKPVVFLVHGMGTHGDDWYARIEQELDARADQYAYFEERSFSEAVTLVPLTYNDLFDQVIDSWTETARELAELTPEHLWLGQLLDWIEDADADTRDFILTNAMDVILYRFYQPVRFAVLTRLIRTMAETINDTISESPMTPISVIAHGLGTAVAHDAIHELGTRTWGGVPNTFGPNIWRFRSIVMLANTSRLLEADVRQIESIVRPGPKADPASYCDLYLNVRHRLDPIAWPKAFTPGDFPPDRTLEVELLHFYKPNIHGFDHYLTHPRTHIPLFRSVLSRPAVTTAEELERVAGFPRWGGEFTEPFEKLERDLERVIAAIDPEPTPLDYVRALVNGARVIQSCYVELAKKLGIE